MKKDMVLFKYVSEERISILRDGLIRFSQPQAFNDPFELKPHVVEIMDRENVESTITEFFPELIREEYDKQPQQFRSAIPWAVYSAFAESKREELIGNVSSFSGHAAEMLEKSIHEGLEKSIGILSITESYCNLLMWAHYANSHQGFVVELDCSNGFFNRQKSEDDELRHLRKVSYSEVRPNIQLNQLSGLDVFLMKSKEWEYEQEWRMLLPLEISDRKIHATPYDIHLFKLPFEAIKSVIVGARAEQRTLEAIQSEIDSNRDLQHVKVYQMSIHPKRFELVMHE
jgi:hypothetical protein